MKWKGVIAAALLCALSLGAFAQTDDPEPEGKSIGGYNVKQSFEFGGRIKSGFGGNTSMYNTLVNLQEGPRLLDQSLSMRSENHAGVLFDTLTESATGFGGDPNQIGRFRMSKNKWYDFAFTYRHDQYYSDYNLLGNSLATPVANPYNVNVFNVSPHFMNTRRTMADFDLTILPKNWVSLRMGYTRGKDVGPALTSQHSPGDVLYLEDFSTRSDRYRVGVDVKPFAKTTVSYDFIYEHDRNDTAGVQDVNAIYRLGSTSGIGIDPGFSFDPNAKFPNCTFSANNVVNSACPGFVSFSRTQPIKTDIPTHQFAFVSNYVRRLDLAGSVSYSAGSSKNSAYRELFSCLGSSRGCTNSQAGIFGLSSNSLVTGSADFRATVHVSNAWSVDEIFRWVNWRTPAFGSYTNTMAATGMTPTTILTPVTLPAPTTNTLYANFLSDNSKYNTVRVNWKPARVFGGYVGYKVGLRDIGDKSRTDTLTLATSALVLGTPSGDVESDTEHHALIGLIVRPFQKLRFSADTDLMSSSGAVTLISPRHEQTYRFKGAYEIADRATISGSLGLNSRSNDGYALWPAVFLTNGEQYKAHTRSYGLDLDLHATKKVDVNLGWNYDDISELAPQCIPLTPGSANYGFGTTNGVANTCRYTTGAVRSNVYPMWSDYQEKTNTGYIIMTIRPVRRVRLNLGYDITDNGGRQTWLRADDGSVFQMPVDASGNAVVATTQTAVGSVPGFYPWLPQGSLNYAWYRPVVAVSVDMVKGLTFKGGFNNYDYNEKGAQPLPVMGRDFHGNVFTLSLKHSF